MALFLQHQEVNQHWAVWKLEETLEELLSLLPNSGKYKQEVEKFSSVYRRLEWCAVRVLLYTMLGVEKEIRYQENGKPYLADKSFSLSISHTKGYVAVILGGINKEVGIDIEQYAERVRKVAHKFVRDDELPGTYEGTDTWGLLLHWSAKEAVYKCLNIDSVDFREHLYICPFVVCSEGVFEVVECRTTECCHFFVHYRLFTDFVLTYIC